LWLSVLDVVMFYFNLSDDVCTMLHHVEKWSTVLLIEAWCSSCLLGVHLLATTWDYCPCLLRRLIAVSLGLQAWAHPAFRQLKTAKEHPVVTKGQEVSFRLLWFLLHLFLWMSLISCPLE
jgi:hypothetical protein